MNNEIIQEQEMEMARQLEREKRQTILQRLKEAKETKSKIEETQKTINRFRNIYRIINGTTAITLVGLIITFLVMNAQLIFGNLFRVKFIPALSLIEIFILVIVDLVIFLAILIPLVIIYFIANPCEVTDFIGTWWADLFGKICK